MATQVTDHTAQALDKLPVQHKNKTKFEALLSAVIDQVQEVENANWQLLTERDVDTAVGVQLTILGKIVGQERQGVSDDDLFRRYVRARIIANRSKGLLEDLLAVSVAVVDDSNVAHVWEAGTIAEGTLHLRDAVVDGDVGDVVSSFLKDAASAGVKIIVVSQAALDADTFIFPPFCNMNGATGSGSGTIATNGIPSTFPSGGGDIVVDAATAVEETLTYTSHDGTTFTLSGTTANAHTDLAGITLDDSAGKGWSDDILTTQGGQLVDARDN